jgi:hypothetical protein
MSLLRDVVEGEQRQRNDERDHDPQELRHWTIPCERGSPACDSLARGGGRTRPRPNHRRSIDVPRAVRNGRRAVVTLKGV